MPKKTQNTVKLFMSLQDVRSLFDPGDLPAVVENQLNDLIHECDVNINIRKDMNL